MLQISIDDGTRDCFSKPLVLDFFQGCIIELIGITTIALDPDKQLPESDWPWRDGRPLESKIIYEYVNRFLDYEWLREHSQYLVDAVEFLLQILAATAIEEQTIISSQPMRKIIAFMRSKYA